MTSSPDNNPCVGILGPKLILVKDGKNEGSFIKHLETRLKD